MAQSNLVALILQFLTPDLIGRMASALGLDRNILQKGIAAAVPGLLAGFSSVAARPGGAEKVANTARQWSGTLGSFASTVGTGGQSSLVDKGSQMLSSLLGGEDQTALTRAVANFTGVNQGTSSSLLGMLAPVVMGTIAKEQGTRSLDASGIAKFLASQKDGIAAAMPSGFGDLLGSSGLLDSVAGAARTASAAATETARGAASAARTISDTGRRAEARTGAASVNPAYWVIPILALAALAAYFVYHRSEPAQQAVKQEVTTGQTLTVAGLDIGKQVTDSVSSVRAALNGVNDVASAQATLPKLRQVTSQIDQMGAVAGQLSAEQRTVLARVVTPMLASLDQLFDKVLAVPGVAEVLKPAIDNLRAKLLRLTA